MEDQQAATPEPVAIPELKPEDYGLTGQMSAMIDASNRGNFPVSTLMLAKGGAPEAVIAVIRGQEAVYGFLEWQHESGRESPEAGTKIAKALWPDPPKGSAPGNAFGNLWISSPIVCPCPDRSHTERCHEVGCRHHPGAGMRLFRYKDRMCMRCAVCMRPVVVTPNSTPLAECAKRA